jgi:putative SOS response-associated peptidase YedK
MCGRYTLTTTELGHVAATLEAEIDDEAAALHRPRYNVAPGDRCVVVIAPRGRPRLVAATWGLPGERTSLVINARAETLADKTMFRESFQLRRCLVPADGFYEWMGARGDRRPLWFHAPDRGLLWLAGLYQTRIERTLAFAIVTTEANAEVAQAHDRMPVVLAPAAAVAWLAAPDPTLLRPAADGALVAVEVSDRVSSVANDDPACLDPPDPRRPRQLPLL